MMQPNSSTPHFFLIAGEESGDRLGAALMQGLRAREASCQFSGVGGRAMSAAGLESLFPMEDLAIIGILPIISRLPHLVRRVYEAVAAVKRLAPQVLILIDSPEFTHAVARRVRRLCPHIMIINYVSPSVWAWRPGRARRMVRYIDHVLALFPFESEVYKRLHGPPCHYVGHPLVDRMRHIGPQDGAEKRTTVLLMPGSRRSEVQRLLPIFRQVMATTRKKRSASIRWVLPTVPHIFSWIKEEVSTWDERPDVICGPSEEIYPLFSTARAALVASGTATLELALSCVPMVIAYQIPAFEAFLGRWLIRTPVVGLPNIVLHFMYGSTPVFPEFLQKACTPEHLSTALEELLDIESPAYRAQQEAFHEIDRAFCLTSGGEDVSSGNIAAQTVLKLCGNVLP